MMLQQNASAPSPRWILVALACWIAWVPVFSASAQSDGDDLFADEALDEEDDLFGDEDAEDPFAAPDEAPVEDGAAPDTAGTTEATDAAPEAADAFDVDTESDDLEAPVLEASPGGPDSSVEEILVQGQAGQGIEADAAASVTAFDAEDLTAMGIDDIGDVSQYTPNLEIRTAGSTTAVFFIRGVGLNDFTANASGSVAIYQDDIALNLPAIQTGQIFDTEDLQILKGPQGSGPGRNASAGAIHVYSRKPSGELGGFLRVDRGNFGFIDTEGAIEAPLVDDIVSARGAFRYTLRDGIVENRCARFSAAEHAAPGRLCGNIVDPEPGERRDGSFKKLEEDLNDLDTWAARGQFRILPPDSDVELLFNLHGGRIDQLATVGEHIGTQQGLPGNADRIGYRQPEINNERLVRQQNYRDRGLPAPARLARQRLAGRLARRPLDKRPFQGDYNVDGFERMDTIGGFLRTSLELDAASLSSTTGIEHYNRDRIIDADYSPNRLFEFIIDDDAWQVTQDLRAEGDLETLPITWRTGAYYLQEELTYDQQTPAGDSLTRIDQAFVQKTWSWGVYAGATWAFRDNFELEAGVRHNWERKGFNVDIRRGGLNVCNPPPGAPVPDCGEQRRTFQEPTGTIALRWLPTDSTSAYLKYSHGWKGAQFNVRDGTDRNIAIDVADPEQIDSMEFGLHGDWLDGRFVLDTAFFWYSYQNYQVFAFTNDADTAPQRVVLNANDAVLYGAELEVVALPVEQLQLDLRFGWLESKFLDFTDTGSRLIAGTGLFFEQVIDYNGNRLPNTPRFKVSGGAKYDIRASAARAASRRAGTSPGSTTSPSTPPKAGERRVPWRRPCPPTRLARAHRGPEGLHAPQRSADLQDGQGGNVEVAGWVRNVTNEVYKTLAFDASQSVGFVGNLVGVPRTFGGSVTFQF